MSKWVTAWGLAVSYAGEGIGNYVGDTTFRHKFYSPIGGGKIRLRFSNVYGKEDVVLDEVRIAESVDGISAIDPNTTAVVTFSENGNVIKSGEELLSDAVEFSVEAGKTYAVSFYLKNVTQIATGVNRFAGDKFNPCWIARGNCVDEGEFSYQNRMEVFSAVCFCGVDVESADETKAIMAFGDSITVRAWPDYLARRINEEGLTNCSVVRKAIGGNRVLRDYRNNLLKRRMGIAAVERFEMSIKQVMGVESVIMFEGINDLGHPQPNSLFSDMDELPTAEEVIEGYKKCIDIAHKYGAKIYLCTILPFDRLAEYAGDRENIREAINAWIRNNDYADGFIEFEQAVADKENPKALAAEYDSGDHLHPSDAGSRRLCEAVPASIYNK